tara:strand:- start:60 stop:677 length:618 start_codon:yes stop_codon:yes gene_type:complete
MSIHTKTSLKSVKKGDLVEMYLDLQAKYNDIELSHDGWMGTLEEYKNNKEELKEVKKENDNLEEELLQSYNKGNDFIKEIKKLKKEKKYAEKCCQENFGCMIELGKENDKLKKEVDCLSASVSADVWSPQGLLNVLDNYDLNWTEAIDEVKKLKEENKELTKYCEISTIIADMEVSDIYEHAEITDAERLCELGWADKDDFACLR